jgi:hypothetical protein
MTSTLAQKLQNLAGTWGRPPDDVSKVALGLAGVTLLLALAGRGRSLLGLGETPVARKLFLWIAGFAAALLSIVYIAIYLRGGPRIIDATTYFLQGRALSHGDLAWGLGEPSASFRGRFLVHRELGPGSGAMGGIFPPGFPLLLSLGFGLGAPMVVGPALAAACVLATYRLTRTITEEAMGAGARTTDVEATARLAALLSVFCGALRYHTADTMAHGATALGIALALDAALRRDAVVAGLAVGAVIATRPVSAAPVTLVAIFLFLPRASSPAGPRTDTRRALLRFALATLPGIALLLVALGARPDLTTVMMRPFFWWKLSTMAVLAAIGLVTALRSFDPASSPRPGLRRATIAVGVGSVLKTKSPRVASCRSSRKAV